jgi:hypothetical protein
MTDTEEYLLDLVNAVTALRASLTEEQVRTIPADLRVKLDTATYGARAHLERQQQRPQGDSA